MRYMLLAYRMNVRLFVAVEITEEIQKRLSAFQNALKKAGADVSWVAPENLHITLKFIGALDEEKNRVRYRHNKRSYGSYQAV